MRGFGFAYFRITKHIGVKLYEALFEVRSLGEARKNICIQQQQHNNNKKNKNGSSRRREAYLSVFTRVNSDRDPQ